jgi:hypothetical protein
LQWLDGSLSRPLLGFFAHNMLFPGSGRNDQANWAFLASLLLPPGFVSDL